MARCPRWGARRAERARLRASLRPRRSVSCTSARVAERCTPRKPRSNRKSPGWYSDSSWKNSSLERRTAPTTAASPRGPLAALGAVGSRRALVCGGKAMGVSGLGKKRKERGEGKEWSGHVRLRGGRRHKKKKTLKK